jgi:PleD family two-component response regulator
MKSSLVNGKKYPFNGVRENKGTVLVVDDSSQDLDLLTEILIEDGFEVRPAKTCRMALASALTILPDLILVDVGMPGNEGYAVCRRLKEDERTRDVPVIFIGAWEKRVDNPNGVAENSAQSRRT